MFDIKDVLDLAIQIETNAEKVYRRLIAHSPDPVLSDGLKWIADQETEHAQWFADMRQRLDRPVDDPRMEEMGRDLLRQVMGAQSFSLGQARVGSIRDVRDLLQLIVRFEHDTIGFYDLFRMLIEEPEDLALLERIIDEEQRHLLQIETYFQDSTRPPS